MSMDNDDRKPDKELEAPEDLDLEPDRNQDRKPGRDQDLPPDDSLAPEREGPDPGHESGVEGDGEEGPPVSLETVALDAADVARRILDFFPKVKDPTIKWRIEDGSVWIDVIGDASGRLIGRKGQTIEAFQHVISKIISHRLRKKITINVDAEDYKKRLREKLTKLAIQTADYVVQTREPRALEPMSPADRRIIHLTLRDRDDILTASEGKEPSRFVVIWPAEEEE